MTIQVNELCLKLNSKEVLRNISLEFKEGQKSLILGANGSGKSSLIKCLVNYYTHYSGDISVNGKRSIGVLLDKPFFYNNFNIKNNINLFKYYLNCVDENLEVFEMLKIGELLLKKFKNLSEGQKQRVLLYFAMMHTPSIIILDEPFNNLDTYYTNQLNCLISEFAEKKLLIVVDHTMNFSISNFDTVIILRKGEILMKIPSNSFDKLYFLKSNLKLQQSEEIICQWKQGSFHFYISNNTVANRNIVSRKIESIVDLYNIISNYS